MPRSNELEIVESEPEPKPDPVRTKVDEWLVGIQATREGRADMFFIRHIDDSVETVTTENVDEVEARIRNAFGEIYPDLIIIDAEATEIMGDLNPGPQVSESPNV
jgi:hypothetical protein